jgi:hypothetical protein
MRREHETTIQLKSMDNSGLIEVRQCTRLPCCKYLHVLRIESAARCTCCFMD